MPRLIICKGTPGQIREPDRIHTHTGTWFMKKVTLNMNRKR